MKVSVTAAVGNTLNRSLLSTKRKKREIMIKQVKLKETMTAQIVAVFTPVYSCDLLNLFTTISGYFTTILSFSLFLSIFFP